MKIRAAILWERGRPLSIEEADLDAPGEGEILVEVKAAGVCHSDLHPVRDEWRTRTPVVLGHEGAGIVREVGPGVSDVRAGDHVVFCWAPACGTCAPCAEGRAVLCDRLDRTTYRNRLPSGATRLRARDQALGHFLSTACFAEYTVVSEEGAVVVQRGGEAAPGDEAAGHFDALAMLGCAVVTGVGAVLGAARVPPGAKVAVIGVGGVGLSVLQGASLARCERAIALDRHTGPLEIARRFGATDLVAPGTATPAAAVRELTGERGADFVFDTVGTPETLRVALECARKGGTVVLTGLSRLDATAGFPMFPFVMQEKRLIGSAYGSANPADDIRRLAGWWREGRLKLGELASRTYPLIGANDALDALTAAAGGRGVLRPQE